MVRISLLYVAVGVSFLILGSQNAASVPRQNALLTTAVTEAIQVTMLLHNYQPLCPLLRSCLSWEGRNVLHNNYGKGVSFVGRLFLSQKKVPLKKLVAFCRILLIR